jgi:hypothetical protein
MIAYLFVRLTPGISASQGALIGTFWFCLTLAFEFGFGHLVQHKSWPDLLQAYTFKDGNIGPLVLLVTLLAPAVAAWLGKK